MDIIQNYNAWTFPLTYTDETRLIQYSTENHTHKQVKCSHTYNWKALTQTPEKKIMLIYTTEEILRHKSAVKTDAFSTDRCSKMLPTIISHKILSFIAVYYVIISTSIVFALLS